MALDGAGAWKVYTNMSCVQTAAYYGYLETLVGRPVTESDVEPITWAVIQRGRGTDGVRHIWGGPSCGPVVMPPAPPYPCPVPAPMVAEQLPPPTTLATDSMSHPDDA